MIDASIFSGTNFRAGPTRPRDHCPGLLSARPFYWQLVRLRTGIPSKATHEYTPRRFNQIHFNTATMYVQILIPLNEDNVQRVSVYSGREAVPSSNMLDSKFRKDKST
ncbi:hypothetical protein CDL15_Pgr000069 [Punica granatum]|uniref:Uncharacterized protein n=1 Tax=Punica granatum TaxID=22663 RepID=A0A218VQR9_PUNGR|nr:hypothetical protein CDL15_Pgr000069 [Punica granatum]